MIEQDPKQLLGERIAGRFLVERLIGSGPLSTAFQALDERLHRKVTVKLFHPRHSDDSEVVRTQLASSRAVARLAHEHIALVIDSGEHEGAPLIVLEYVRGESLLERIERFAPLAINEVSAYGLQIARALAYAHTQGVVHGNIRPENILLTEDRDVKIVDFGGGSYVAQLVGDPYTAPELSELDPGAPSQPGDDIYALGALLFVALTGQAPRADVSAADLQLLRPDITRVLATAIVQCLAMNPDARHASMRDLASALANTKSAPVHNVRDGDTRSLGVIGADTQEIPLDDLDGRNVQRAGVRSGRSYHSTGQKQRTKQHRKRPRNAHQTRARILAWSMVLVPLVVLTVVGFMIAGEHSLDLVDQDDQRAKGPPVTVPIVGAVSFDPEPEGDGVEHPEEVDNVYDDDLSTVWETEGYETKHFSQLKQGVGIIVELERPADVHSVAIITRLPSWSVRVYAAPRIEDKLDGWSPLMDKPEPVRSGDPIPVSTENIAFEGEKPGRTKYLLFWITSLAIDINNPSVHRARIAEIQVSAARE